MGHQRLAFGRGQNRPYAIIPANPPEKPLPTTSNFMRGNSGQRSLEDNNTFYIAEFPLTHLTGTSDRSARFREDFVEIFVRADMVVADDDESVIINAPPVRKLFLIYTHID